MSHSQTDYKPIQGYYQTVEGRGKFFWIFLLVGLALGVIAAYVHMTVSNIEDQQQRDLMWKLYSVGGFVSGGFVGGMIYLYWIFSEQTRLEAIYSAKSQYRRVVPESQAELLQAENQLKLEHLAQRGRGGHPSSGGYNNNLFAPRR